MSTTDQLNALQGHARPAIPMTGVPTRIWLATVTTVNADGTVNATPLQGRADKINVPVPAGYTATIGDVVVMADVLGDALDPIVLAITMAAVTAASLYGPGDLKATAVTAAPAGWLMCDGASHSSATYPSLFAAISHTYGGTGSTFNVPDLRGRVPVGAGTGTAAGATAHALGSQPTTGPGGEETHTLTTSEMPSHNHGGNTGGITTNAASTDPALDFTGSGASRGLAESTVAAPANTYNEHEHSIAAQGGGGAHNIMQPLAVVNWLIKT